MTADVLNPVALGQDPTSPQKLGGRSKNLYNVVGTQ